MTKYIVVFCVGVLIGLAQLVSPKVGSPNSEKIGISNPIAGVRTDSEEMKPIPYSIESFRRKDYPAGSIEIEGKVGETNSFISYRVAYDVEGLKQYALLNIPRVDMPEAGYPVVIVNHGYIDPELYSTEGSYINTSAFYARSGFLVLKPDYRGHDRSEGETGNFFSKIMYTDDVMYLIYAVASISEADEDHIFLYGHSMGGEITLRILEITEKVKAAALWAPAVTEFPKSHFYFVERNPRGRDLSGYRQQLNEILKEDQYEEVSVLSQVDRVKAPIIIHHGTEDESVPYEWGTALEAALIGVGKIVTMYTYPGDNHDMAGNFQTALSRDVSFFRSLIQGN